MSGGTLWTTQSTGRLEGEGALLCHVTAGRQRCKTQRCEPRNCRRVDVLIFVIADLIAVNFGRMDVSSREEAAQRSRGDDGPAVGGLVHAGGILWDAVIPRTSASQVRAVFAAKWSSITNVYMKVTISPLFCKHSCRTGAL